MAARDARLSGCVRAAAAVLLAITGACGDHESPTPADKPAPPASSSAAPPKPAPAAPGTDLSAADNQIDEALHRAPGVAPAATCKFKPWHAPGTFVGLCSAPASKDAKLVAPHVILVATNADKPTPVASTQLVLGETNCETMSGQPLSPDEAPAFELDLAAYTLAPGNDAIGVRLSCHNEFPSGEGTETRLYLFERQGDKLRQIFDQRIAWTNEDRVAGSETSGRSVVIMQKEAHDGRADLVLRTTTSEADLGSEPTLPKNQAPRAKSQRFAFSADRYEPASDK